MKSSDWLIELNGLCISGIEMWKSVRGGEGGRPWCVCVCVRACMCALALMKWREGLALQDGAMDAVQGSEPGVNWV